jgi:glycosyltransferase involved in cell wall biosynthesis
MGVEAPPRRLGFGRERGEAMGYDQVRGQVLPFGDKMASRPSVAIVIPFFNEAPNLARLMQALDGYVRDAGAHWSVRFEIVLVDDGGADGGCELLRGLAAEGAWATDVRLLRLSRNFGKEAALTAGLAAIDTDAVVLMDADLQHPVQTIDAFLHGWLKEGYEVVYAYQERGRRQTWWKAAARTLFHRLVDLRRNGEEARDAGDFRLLSRSAYRALRQFGERQRLMKGLYGWIGFRQKGVAFTAPERLSGASKFSLLKLFALGVEGVTSFSVAPLRMAVWAGAALGVLSGAYGLWTVFEKLVFGVAVPGYPTIVVIISLVGAAQLFFLGVIGEYLGKVLIEVKGRPLFILESESHFASATSAFAREDAASPGAMRALNP